METPAHPPASGPKEGPKLDAAADAVAALLTRDANAQLFIIRQIRKWMDEAVTVPGTKVKLGLDPVIGLIPVIGDLSSAAIGGYVLLAAHKLGVPTIVLVRMLGNLAVDALIGFVPIVGDYLDVLFKANAKNVALVEQAIVNRETAARSSWWRFVGVLAVFVSVVLGGFVGAVLLAKWLWNHTG